MSQNINKQLSFRPRNIDHLKPMQVLRTEDVPDLNNLATTINRTVPQMPTGMEKDEESEHHLQRAISAQQAYGRAVDHVIPTPEVFPVDEKSYDELYPPTYKIPKQLIHVQLPSFEQDYPEYDLDSDDETWLSTTNLFTLQQIKFEEMIDCLERNSGVQKVIELNEAKSLLRGVDESLQIAVYDYWLTKKLKYGKSLIPTVKTEKRDGTSGNNPYIAFRRRTEKMQTRKNRKNDEYSYEKMLKLKKDFLCVRDLMAMIKEREHTKCEIVKNDFLIFKTRYQLKDFNSQIYNELMSSRLTKDVISRTSKQKGEETSVRKKRTKRTKNDILSTRTMNELITPANSGECCYTSEDENSSDLMYQSSHVNNDQDDADNPDGLFAFKRKKGCHYHAALDHPSSWPWESIKDGGTADERYGYHYTSLSCPAYSVSLTRRRIGRGGRIHFDRLKTPIDFDDEDDGERIIYKPLPVNTDIEPNETVEFNSKYFDENYSSFLNNHLKYNDDASSLERKLYLYNEHDLINFIEENHRQSSNDYLNKRFNSLRHHKRLKYIKPTNGKIKPNINHKNNQQTSFVCSIKIDLTNSLLNNADDGLSDSASTLPTRSSSIDNNDSNVKKFIEHQGIEDFGDKKLFDTIKTTSDVNDESIDGFINDDSSGKVQLDKQNIDRNSNGANNLSSSSLSTFYDSNNKSDIFASNKLMSLNNDSSSKSIATDDTSTNSIMKFDCQSAKTSAIEFQQQQTISSSILSSSSSSSNVLNQSGGSSVAAATAINNIHHSNDVT